MLFLGPRRRCRVNYGFARCLPSHPLTLSLALDQNSSPFKDRVVLPAWHFRARYLKISKMTTPLPLTTLFDPPSSCFSSFFRVSAWGQLGISLVPRQPQPNVFHLAGTANQATISHQGFVLMDIQLHL